MPQSTTAGALNPKSSSPPSSAQSPPTDVAKLLTSDQIVPERVLILDSIRSRNFRGKLSTDDAAALLETMVERKSPSLKLEYFCRPASSDGLGAVVLVECEVKGIRRR